MSCSATKRLVKRLKINNQKTEEYTVNKLIIYFYLIFVSIISIYNFIYKFYIIIKFN